MTSRRELANAIRALSMDAVQRARSGHPGAPMGMADIAQVLWCDHLKHNPANPGWYNRDRFVLSNGHGSMLLYALLHLSGYAVSIEDIKNFRQLDSKTAGHPEYGDAPGIETTTGPLGQGLANAVGMALAEKILAAQFNRPEHAIVDHHTYVFLGDGCLMEGISHEVCSLAGTLGLNKLIAFYDDNGISIDGEVTGWFTDNTPQRFASYGWQVIEVDNGHDAEAINTAILRAKANPSQPTLICCKTTIGFGSPNKAGKESCHGSPLGDEEIVLTREALNWPYAPFEIPDAYYDAWDAKARGHEQEGQWDTLFSGYCAQYPDLAREFKRRMQGGLLPHFDGMAEDFIQQCQEAGASIASRKASQNTIEAFAPHLPELLGGSADLAGSNLTLWPQSQPITAEDASGNYLFYGVREFGMSAIMNGLALHGGFIAYGATFLVFMEYARNALRMAALMQLPVIHIYTHDSIGLGEDGPTHQPVEQLTNMRTTPNLYVWRPCDAVESAVAWYGAISRGDGPTALVFSRQSLQHQNRTPEQVENIRRGGYILRDCAGLPDVIFIATGSEVQLAMEAAAQLDDYSVRVVSMPCTERFDAQSDEYKESVLPKAVGARIAVEAAHKDYWYKYTGLQGKVIGMDRFGKSAPAAQLFELFGFTVDNLVATARTLLA